MYKTNQGDKMKFGIVLNTNDAETVWNSLRFGVTSLLDHHEVKLFLLGKGVDLEQIEDNRFDIGKQIVTFIDKGGRILACGTCLTLRNKEISEVCPLSTMHDLLELVKESDRILTFG